MGEIEMAKPEITAMDERLMALAQSGDIEAFAEALLMHPIHGPLMKTFALEEAAPEYEETMKRIREKFGVPQEISSGRD